MRARPYIWTWAAVDNDTGLKLLERATAIDPAYAHATGLLGWTYAARAHLGVADPNEMLAKALTLAERAIDQDTNDPWAHLAAGYVHMVARHFQPAVDQLNEAIDRNPSFAIAHMVMSSTYGYGGMPDEGMRHVEMAMRLSPAQLLSAGKPFEHRHLSFRGRPICRISRVSAPRRTVAAAFRHGMAQPCRFGRNGRRSGAGGFGPVDGATAAA